MFGGGGGGKEYKAGGERKDRGANLTHNRLVFLGYFSRSIANTKADRRTHDWDL